MIVFEPELWNGSALLPSGKVATRYGAAASRAAGAASATGGTPAAVTAPAKSSSGLKLWDGGSFDFHDILDVINPLHHLPIVNSIYRAETGDEIGAVPRILGSMLYGGGLVGALVGAASAVVNIVVEHETGKDLGQHIYTALFGEGAAGRRTTQVAASKTGGANAGETKPAETPNAASAAQAAKAASAAVAGAAAAQKAQAVQGSAGAKTITPKAHAALQAFVAGLAKSASPAAAAAAKSAIAKSAVRIAGAASSSAGANGAATKGEISSQFRRADWYQRNQAVLMAQAAALAKHRAATKSAAGTTRPAAKSTPTDAASAILQLFTTPGGPAAKPVAKSNGPGAGTASKTKATPAASAPPVNTAPAKPSAARRGAIAGPWVANEIANALSKYEALVKARNGAAAAK
ncbi:MAG: hypothetical protein OEQ29_00050 [Alphaproteobacteria bacterium]|nr:hypothetical protein [Alphaproteobacteria bacterium]